MKWNWARLPAVKGLFTLFTFKTRDLYLRFKHIIPLKKERDWDKQGGNTRMDVFTAISQISSGLYPLVYIPWHTTAFFVYSTQQQSEFSSLHGEA